MKLSTSTRIATWVLFFCFGGLCAALIPPTAEYLTAYLREARGVILPPTVIHIAGTLLCLPCLAFLLLALRLSDAVEADAVFTAATARRVSLLSAILFFDSLALLCGILLLSVAGEGMVSLLLGLIDLVGLALSLLLRILAGYIGRAAILKEEADATL